MPRRWLRFPLTATDQARADPATITVLDGGPAHPDRLRLEFDVTNPAAGPPAVRPLFPGVLSFLADPGAPGVLPAATDPFTWTDAEYAGWRTVGTLVMELDPTLVPALGVRPAPTVAWYWPVRLSRDFLLDSVRHQLVKSKVRRPAGGEVATGDPRWPAHAVSGLLAGTHAVKLRTPAAEDQDDAVRFAMPTVELAADGSTGLWIAVAAGTSTDDGVVPAPVPGTVPLLDPAHPANALLDARRTLISLRSQTIGAEAGAGPLVSTALPDGAWPAGPRWFTVAFSTPGAAGFAYRSGALPAVGVEVTTAAGIVLQQRRLSTRGLITVMQEPTDPAAPPPVVRCTVDPGADLRLAETNGARPGPPETIEFDFATLTEPARVVLQPPPPPVLDAAGKAAYATRLATLSLRLGRTPATREAVGERLTTDESLIRPAAWPAGTPVFRGTRRPWAGAADPANQNVLVDGPGLADLRALFDALQQLTPAPGRPPIRPAEAMVLWLMEGRVALGSEGFFNIPMLAPGANTSWIFADRTGFSGNPFDAAVFGAATEAQTRTLLRSMLLWNCWGMDVFAATDKLPGQDTTLRWEPTIAASAAGHDTKFRTALAAIAAAGFTVPTEAQVNGTIELRPMIGGGWEFRLNAGYVRTHLQIQYGEYLRRQVAYLDPARTAPHPALPAAAWSLPAFNYIAFNGGLAEAGRLWAVADGVLAGGAAPPWVRSHQDALRTFRLTADEQQRTPLAAPETRSRAARVNGLHFAALVDAFGAAYPRVLYP